MIKINENYLKLASGYLFPEIGRRKMALNARRLFDELGSQRILLAIEDVTGETRGTKK